MTESDFASAEGAANARDFADNGEETAVRRSLTFEAQVELNAPNECERTRLIKEISTLLREPMVPDAARSAGLTFIGWLARRLPHETPHELGVDEAFRQTERRMRTEKPSDAAPKSDRGEAPKSRRGR